MKDGKHWPIGISASILFIVGACALTIYIAVKNPVEESNVYMQGYHETDANYNDIMNAKNAFDKLYKIDFISSGISEENTVLEYSLKTLSGEVIKDAKIDVVLTLPYTNKEDIKLENPRFNEQTYMFEQVKLPHPGRWNIMAKITIADNYRYYNLKADTRNPNSYEY